MKSDSSEKSESCCDDSDDENNVPVISSTITTENEPAYEHIEENIYLINKKKHINKEVRKMTCECDVDDDDPCGENCLNRLLMIECNQRCPCGDQCTNKRFQQGCKVKIEVFKTEKKGRGVKTLQDLSENQFVMEYCGEVMNYGDFQKRAEQYDRQKRKHYYFMTLRADEIIDATFKGSLSRFVNHSCDPNCVTQKWTVNGLLRIGFFTLRKISAGEELTFDYQLQRYGKVAQTCFCQSQNCRGIIGGEKHTPLKSAFEKIVATPSTSSPRRNRRKTGRSLENDFEDMSIEEELERLIGDHRGMTHSDEALKLSRLMVRAETTPQRIMLLKVLQNTTDQNCLKAFLRFQGLLLLWSWMVDAGTKPTGKLQLELLLTLKYLPVTTKNQLEDSKILRIVNKWALQEMSEHEMPSSCSSQEENPDDNDRTLTQEDVDERSKKPLQQLASPGFSSKGGGDDDSNDGAKKADKSPDDLSEDDAKSTEDEYSLLSEDGDLQVGSQAYELLKQWSNLKEVYRIPKKSSKQTEVVVATSTTETPAGNMVEQEPKSGKINRRTPMKNSIHKAVVSSSSSAKKSKDRKSEQHRKTTVKRVVVHHPDSSGNIEEHHKEHDSSTLTPLMSVDVPIKSQGDPSNVEPTPKGDLDTPSSEWKSISSTLQDVTPEKGHAIAIVSHDASEACHQVFGYKQKMGNAMGEQGTSAFIPQWTSPNKSKKFPKKTKWKQSPLQQFPLTQVSPQSMRVSTGYGHVGNVTTPQVHNWQGPSPQWPKEPQDTSQAPPYFGASEPQHMSSYQSGQFGQPSSMIPPNNMPPCNIPPPSIPLPPNFPVNIPPPNLIPPGQPFNNPAYARPPPGLPTNLPTNIPPVSVVNRLTAPPPQQSMFVPNYPPPQLPAYQTYNSPGQPQRYPNLPKSEQSPLKKIYTTEQMVKDTSPLKRSSGRDLSPSKPKRPSSVNLPPNWKTATDPQGNIYYYHTVTRKTQWDVPKEQGHEMDIDTPSDEEPMYIKKKPRTPQTPPGTPPRSPTLHFTTAAADTTHKGVTSQSPDPTSHHSDGKQRMKESFRIKLSNVVVNCLNPYYKVDCKQGRITNADDFKYLARKLTHGIMNKELQHVKSEEVLQCNDSVKVKTKEYIRTYMKKYDAIYKRS